MSHIADNLAIIKCRALNTTSLFYNLVKIGDRPDSKGFVFNASFSGYVFVAVGLTPQHVLLLL